MEVMMLHFTRNLPHYLFILFILFILCT